MRDIYEVLNNTFKLTNFRANQKEIIDEIIAGKDVLVLLPTGAGKSLTFQLPMLAMHKKTIVISPLIALMEDQVIQLKSKKIKACCIHSQLDDEDKRLILSNIHQYDFIYCSPEWISVNGMTYLKDYQCAAIVIDEAHCISEWGYEFRPHYLLLDQLIGYYKPQVIALTATANDRVIEDIQQVVGKKLIVMDYLTERKNIFLSVKHTKNDEEKLSAINAILKQSGPTVIYFSSKKQVEVVYRYLQENDVLAERYHADMQYENRMSVQQRFMNDEIQVICATNAFGMGVNKQNIRTVIHYHMPNSNFQYIQEIGRAGRDGLQSQAILLYSEHDEMLAYRLNEMNALLPAEIDMYFHGVQLAEDKQILMDILAAKYARDVIQHKIGRHQQMKTQGTLQMLKFINETLCYSQNLSKTNQNSTDINKKLLCCSLCENKSYLEFDVPDYSVQKKFKKTLLNQLFNGLYDFT